jgi:hypothetical protein
MTRFFDTIVKWLRKASLYTLLVWGLIVVGMAIGYSFFVPGKPLAILVASVGSIVGTAMICMVIPKLVLLKGEQDQSELVKARDKNAELESALAKERSARTELVDRCSTLDEEVARLKRMKVEVNSITPILKLALLQFEGSLTDFCRRPLGKQEGLLSSKTQEYVGACQIDFRSNIGVDLQKTRLRKDGNRLIVSGLKPEFMGFEKYTDTPVLNEVRTFKERLIGRDVAEIETKDPRVLSLAEGQRLEAKQRLEQGVTLHGREEAARRLAEAFLSRILAPFECGIQFVETEETAGVPLLPFLEEHNREMDGQIHTLLHERKLLTSGQPPPA